MGRPQGAKNGSHLSKNCLYCRGSFICHSIGREYCSRLCFYSSRQKSSEETCRQCMTRFSLRSKSGRYRVRAFCNKSCSSKFRMTRHPIRYWLGKARPEYRGAGNPMWTPTPKGDPTKLARKQAIYKDWRAHVFKRDFYTCQSCQKIGGILNADHELPFSLYPDLRYEVLNGRTLCELCHRKTDTFGGRKNPWHILNY